LCFCVVKIENDFLGEKQQQQNNKIEWNENEHGRSVLPTTWLIGQLEIKNKTKIGTKNVYLFKNSTSTYNKEKNKTFLLIIFQDFRKGNDGKKEIKI